MNLKKNLVTKIIVTFGVLIFLVVSYIIIKSTSTVSAIVPKADIQSGIVLTSGMLETIQVPADTPPGFITDSSSMVGQQLTADVSAGNLLYPNDVVNNWTNFGEDSEIPKDYVITSILLPNSRAVAGAIQAGDIVDIAAVPSSNFTNSSSDFLRSALGSIVDDSYGANGDRVYWLLSNVKILDSGVNDSTSTAPSTVDSIANSIDTGASSESTNFYIVALSYSDYNKLLLASQYLDFWMNISPSQNSDHDPLLGEMNGGGYVNGLSDAQNPEKKSGNKTNAVTPSQEAVPSASPSPSPSASASN